MNGYEKILSDLISIDTQSDKSILDLVDYICRYFKSYNVWHTVIYNPERTRASVFAKIGSGNNPVVFSGHMDTVSADAKNWDTNPFVLTRCANKYIGRGVTDMKGAIAVALSMVPYFIENNCDVGFIFTHDEETHYNAITQVLDQDIVMDYLRNARGVIVMEPTMRQIVVRHKNVLDINTVITGRTVHSSNPLNGIDAIYHGICISEIFYALLKECSTQDDSFTVPYPTGIIGTINGGSALNVVPDYAHIGASVRFMSNKALENFISLYRARVSEYIATNNGVQVEINTVSFAPSLESIESKFFENLPFEHALNVSYCTEAGYFSSHGIPTIVYGPGDISDAHTDNESILISQLDGFASDLQTIASLI